MSSTIDSGRSRTAGPLKAPLFLVRALTSILFADLSSVTDKEIHQYQRHHRLGDRRCAYANAWVMTSFGNNVNGFPVPIDALPWLSNA